MKLLLSSFWIQPVKIIWIEFMVSATKLVKILDFVVKTWNGYYMHGFQIKNKY